MVGICTKCHKKLNLGEDGKFEVCQCGSRSYISSTKKIKRKENGYVCCNKPGLSLKLHLNMSPNHLYQYGCSHCGAHIELYNHYEE